MTTTEFAAWLAHMALSERAASMLGVSAAMGCERDVAESVLGHMLPGVEGVYNKYSYDKERVIWLTRLSDRLDQLAAA